jgi:hypothetical protein
VSMKWFVYLFSFFILLLSVIPCNAEDDCCKDEINNTTVPNKQGEADHKPVCPCSPFFACSTCLGVVVPSIYTIVPEITVPVTNLQYFYSDQPLCDYPPSIWQPPQCA